MPDEARLVGAFALALVAALGATPVAIAVAGRTNFHDQPVGYKGHAAPTPYLGGAAVMCAFLLAALASGPESLRLLPVIVLAFGLWALGTLDDRISLDPTIRLVAESVAAVVLWGVGLGWDVFGGGVADLVLTGVWVVGLVNAFNLMDNMDGAAATVGAVTGLATAVLALIEGDLGIALLSGGLAGACVGFLPYNLAGPARIFLGDGGSLPIGFVLAACVMALSHRTGDRTLFLAAFLLAGLPLLDTTLVMISRRRVGIPLLTGGRDHLTHRLLSRLASARTVAVTLGAAQALLGAMAIGAVQLGQGSTVAAWSTWFVTAAAAIVLLESRGWAPSRTQVSPAPLPHRPISLRMRTPGALARPPGPGPALVEGVLIVFVAIAFGLSPALSGFYDLSVWGPVALLLLAALFGLVVARPASPRPAALLALSGLVFLWLWSLISMGWGESADAALMEANRWLLYAALLGVLVLLLRDDRVAKLLLLSVTAAIVGLALFVTGQLLLTDVAPLFLRGRLNEPLGYANGQAGYFLLGLWPLVAVAEQARSRLLSGAAVAGAVLIGGLVLLTQTRAVAPAFLLTLLVLVAGVPGRRRRLWILFFVGAGVALAAAPLIDIYQSASPASAAPDTDVVRRGMAVLVAVAAIAGLAWSATGWLSTRAVGWLGSRRAATASSVALISLLLLGSGVAVAAVGNPVKKARSEARDFVELRQHREARTRLTSGAGNRYDYWRIAVDEFRRRPLAGVGAGNYDRYYYTERRSGENIRQPHSIELQTLAELGLPGVVGFCLFLVGITAGLWRRASRARQDRSDQLLAVAAGGMFLTWLFHTSIDWLHLIPGVTGVALAAAAVLVAPWRAGPAARAGRRRLAITVVAAGVVLFGAAQVGRSALAQHYRAQAEDVLPFDPVKAIQKANDSLALNDEALPAYYAKAAAYARLDRYRDSRSVLLEAARREPHDFVTWALLGDLATRRGDLPLARRYYRRASRLNPREPYIRRYTRQPRAVN